MSSHIDRAYTVNCPSCQDSQCQSRTPWKPEGEDVPDAQQDEGEEEGSAILVYQRHVVKLEKKFNASFHNGLVAAFRFPQSTCIRVRQDRDT